MKKTISLSGIFSLVLFSQTLFAQQDSFLKDHLERWEQSGKYLVIVAEAMPESEYNFKPTSEQSTFAQQLMHIACIIDWHGFAKVDGQEYKPRWDEFKAEGRSKKEIIEIVNREFERGAKLIADFDPKRLDETAQYSTFTRTRRQLFMLMTDHVTHHRAQILVYM